MNSNTHNQNRKPHQKKRAQKGVKSQRGKSESYEQLKERYSLSLTPIGAEKLDAMAAKLGISRSEFVERIARGIIPLSL